MPVSDADGLFKNPLSFVKPLTTPEVNAPSGQFSSVPMPGAVPSMTGGSGGFGSRRGFGKLGSGSSLDVSAPKNTPYAKNLEKINKAGGIDGFDASVSLYNIKARSAEAAQQALQRMNGQQPVQAAQPQFPKDMPEEQQAAPAQVTAGWQTQFKKPDEEGFAESLQQPQEFTAPAPAADTSVGQMVSQTQRGPGESLTLSPTGEKIRTRGYAVASKDIVSTHAPNQYSDDDAEAEAIENEARYISQKIYGVDSDALAEMTTKQYKDKTFTSKFAAQWQNDLRMLAGFERKMHTADLSNKDIEAWQAAASRLRSNAAMLGLYNAIASAPVMQDASAELQRDVVSAVRNFNEEKVKRYVPQLLSNKTYKRLMDAYQSGDRSVRGSLRALGDLFDSNIKAEKAEEDDVSGWFDFGHWDLLKRNAQTVWNRVSKGLLLTVGDIKDAYYDVRDKLAGTPVTDAQKAEAEARKEEQRFNKIAMQLISDDRRTEQDQIDQASDTYRIYERIARSRDIMAGRDSGSIVSAASKFIHSPLTYASSMSADSADSILGIAAALAVGAVSKTAAVHMIRSNIMRGVGVGLTRGQKLFTTGVGLTGTALVGAESVGVPNASDAADSIANASVDRLVSNGSFVPFAMQDQYRTKSDARIIANRLLQPGGVIEQGLAQQGNPDGQEYYANAVQLGQLIADMHLKAGDAADSDTPLTEQQIKDFYNNPLVIRNLQENPDSSLLISQYRTHLWGTGYDKAINPQRLVGAGEALAAPLFAGAGISGAAAKGIDNLLSHVIDSPTARSIISKALYAHLEEGGSETIEQIFQNFSGLQAEGREVTWDELSKNLGASFFGGAVLGGVMASPRLAYEGYRAIRSGQQQPPVGGGNGPANPPAGPTPFSPLTGFTNTVQDPAARDADMQSYNDTVNWYNGLSDTDRQLINGAFDASHMADAPFGTMTRDELDKRVQSIQQVQQHLRDEQQALSSIQDPAKRTEAANRIVQDQREAQRLLNTLNRARLYYTDTGTITGIWQGDKQSDGSIDYISSRTVKRADIDSMRKKFDESTATQETLDVLNQLRQRDSTGKTRWALYDNDTLVRYNLSPAAAASGVPVYPRNTKATFIPVKYVHIDSKGVPHFSSVYGQWSDTEKQLFDDFRKKVGKPVSDVRAWRAKDGRMGVRYKLGGNVTAITFDDLAKQYGLNQQPQGQTQTQTQQPQPQGQTQTQQPQPQGQTQTQQPQGQTQTQTQQPQPQGQTQQPQGQTQQPQGQTQQPQGQTQTQQQKTPFEEMQDNEKNLLEYLNKAAKDLVARTSWGRKQKDDNNCFKGLANTVTNYVKYINRLRQKGPNGQQAITDQQADETLQKVRDAYSNALRTIINGLADRSYSDAAAKAMAYFATENLNSYTDVAESVAAIIRAIDDTRSVYWPSAPTKWDLQFCNTVRGRILGYMGLCMVQSPTALDDYPAEYKAQAQRIADEIKAKKLAVAIYAKDLNNYKSQDAAPQTVAVTADYIIRDIDRAATPPKTEEKKTPEPQPETKKTPEPQPETKKTPEPQPETKKTPEPQPETKKTPEPQPEQTKSTKKKAPDYESKSKTFTSIKEKEAQLRALIQQLSNFGGSYWSVAPGTDISASDARLIKEIKQLNAQLNDEWNKLTTTNSKEAAAEYPELTDDELRANRALLKKAPITLTYDEDTGTVGDDLNRAQLYIWATYPSVTDDQIRNCAFDAIDRLIHSTGFQTRLSNNTFNHEDFNELAWSAAAEIVAEVRPVSGEESTHMQEALTSVIYTGLSVIEYKLAARYKGGESEFWDNDAHAEVLNWIHDNKNGLGRPLSPNAQQILGAADKTEGKTEETSENKTEGKTEETSENKTENKTKGKTKKPASLRGLNNSLNSLTKKRPDIAEKVGSAQNEVSICEKALAEVQKELESHGEDDKTYYENQVKKAQKALEGAQKTLAKKQKALAEIDQQIADKTKQIEDLKAKQEAEEKAEKEKAEKEKAEKERAAQEAEEKKKAEQEAAEKKRKENLRRLSAVSRMVPADSNEASQMLINESNRKDFSELKDKTIDLSFTPATEKETDKYGLDLEIGVLIAGGKWTTAVGNILDELSKHGALLNKRLLQGDITRADWVQLLTPYCDRPERLSELRQALICVENIIHAHCQTEWAPEGTIPVNDRKFEEIVADPFVQWRKDNGLPLTHNETIAFSEIAKQAEAQKQAEEQKQAEAQKQAEEQKQGEQTPMIDEEKLEATIAECDNRAKDLARQIRDAKAALDKARDAADKFAIALMDAKGDMKAALQAANDAADAEAEKQYDLYNQLLADNTANERARAEASAKLDELRKAKETKNGTKPETGSADIGSNSAPQPGAQPEGNTAKEAGQTNSGPADRVNPAAEGTGNGRTGTQNPGAVTGNVPPAQQVRTAGTNPDGHRVPEQSEPAAAQTNNGAGSTAGEGSSGKANGPVENAAGKGAGQSGSGTVNSDPRTWHPDINTILKPGINDDTYDRSDPYSNLTPEWQGWVRQAAPVLADAIKSGALPFIRGEENYHYEMRMLEYLGVAEVNDLPGLQAVAISESFNRILDREYNVETLRTKNNHDLDELITGIQRENKSSIGENKPETKPAASPQIKHEAADRFNREQLVAKFESAANSLFGNGAAEFDKMRKYIRDSLEGKFSGVFAGLYPTGMDKATEQRDLDEMADKITMAILPVLLPVYNMFSLQGWKFEFYIEPRLVKGLGAFNFRPTEKMAYIVINLGKLASANVNLKSLPGLHMDKAARAEAAKNLIPLEVASCVWHEALHALHYITGTEKTSIRSLNVLADAVSALVDPELIKQFKAQGLRDTDIYVETVSTAIEMLVRHANLTTNGESYAARLLGQLIADTAKYAATPEYQQLPFLQPSVHDQRANLANNTIRRGLKFIRDRVETASPNTPPIAAYEHMLRQLWGLAYASAPYHPEGARLLKTLSNVLDVMTGDQQLDNALVLLYGRLRGAVTYDGLSMQDVKTRYILTTWSRKYWQILQERCRQHKSGEAVVKEVVMDLADLTGLSENELFQIVPYDDLFGQIRADIGKIGMSRNFLAQLDESNMSAFNLKDMIDAAQAAAQSVASGNSAQSKTNVNKPEQKPQPKSESKSEPQTKNIKAKEQTPDDSTKAEAENLKKKLDNTPTAETVETKTKPTQQETAETKAKLDVAGTTNQPESKKKNVENIKNSEYAAVRNYTKFRPILIGNGHHISLIDGTKQIFTFSNNIDGDSQPIMASFTVKNENDLTAEDRNQQTFTLDTQQQLDTSKPFAVFIGANTVRQQNSSAMIGKDDLSGIKDWLDTCKSLGVSAAEAIDSIRSCVDHAVKKTKNDVITITAKTKHGIEVINIPIAASAGYGQAKINTNCISKITTSKPGSDTVQKLAPAVMKLMLAISRCANNLRSLKNGRTATGYYSPVMIYSDGHALILGSSASEGNHLFDNLFIDSSQIDVGATAYSPKPTENKKSWIDTLGPIPDNLNLGDYDHLSIEPSEADGYMESADDPELSAEGEFDAVSPQPSAPDFNVDDSDDFDTGDSDINTDTPLDDGSWDIYGLNTPADVQRYAGLWAALTAKVTQAVKRTALHRRAQQQQTKDSLNMNNMFYENRVTRAVVKHLISNWDKSDAELRLWVRENFQGEIDPDDNFITQAIVLARRNVGVMLDLSAQILQYGVTANEDGELVHIQDENGNAVESVFQLTKRWLNTLRKNKVRTDTVGELIDYRNDMGMFRTLMHTFEANEMLHRRMIEQYQALEQQINDVMSTSNDAKKLKELTKQHDALADKIRDFENLMQVTDLADTDIKSVVPAGGRTNAMAKAQLDELYHKYYDALLKGGMSHDEAQAMMQQMIGEFNTAYTVAIGELDKVTAMYGLVSEQELNERHAGFNYYTPLRASVGSGVGSIHKESEGSTHEARDAIYNFAAQALRVAETAGDNEIGTALFDAYNTLAQQYKINMATGDPATIMKVISHKVFDLKGRGGIYSFNGLLVIDSDTLSSIEATYKDDTTQTRIGNFRKSAIVIDLVDTVNDNELKNGETAETVTRKVWVGFDPDPIGRAGKVYPESDAQLEGREENGGIGNCYIGANGELVAPKVEVRDYRGVGEALASVYGQNHEKAGKFMRACGMLTRAVSECMTTFSPLFAPKASVRDIFERGQYCVRHQFTAADGSTVNGVTVMLRMWKNLLMNPAFLIQGASASMNIAHHKESRNKSRYAKYVNEMYRRGLLGNMQQQYVANGDTRADIYGPTALDKVKARVAEGDADSITKRYYKMLHKAVPYSKIGLVGRFCKLLHQKALGWANFFYNASLAAQYVALRESGCSVDTAAAATANAMDFANQGKYAKYGTKMFSFFNSIMHGSANYFDSWGLNANATSANPNLKRTHYYRRMLGRSITAKGIRLAAMLGLVQIVTAAMGAFCRPDDPEDDLVKGQRLLDTTPLRNMTFLPLPLLQMFGLSDQNGVVAKLVGGFGEDAQAMNLAWGIDRLSRDKATGAEVLGSLAVNLVTNTTPFEAPAADAGSNPFRYIGYTAVKANPVGSLIADALFNMTYSGHSLVSDYDQQFGMRAYQTRDPYTEVRCKEISEWLYKHTGGMLDISPKIIQSIANGAGFGPIVSAGRDLLMHIGDEVPKSELDPNWDTAHVNAGMKAFGITSLGNKFPEMPGLFTSQQIKYWDGVFTKAGVSELMKADPGEKNKVDKIQATMRSLDFSEEEVIDYVNLWGVQQEMKKIRASMNDLYDEFHRGDIDSDQYIDGMQELYQQAYDLQYDYMKNSYYYRGVYGKRTDFDEDALAEVRSQVEGEE